MTDADGALFARCHVTQKPPSEWEGVSPEKVSDEIYFKFFAGETHPIVWHWCKTNERWIGGQTSAHTVVSRKPLHLEPSLYWPECCRKHGFIRQGNWEEV